MLCTTYCCMDSSDHAWHQARLSLSRGGLGLRSVTQHSPAAYIASLCTFGFGSQSQHHLVSAIQMFNSFVPPSEATNSEALLLTPVTQKSLSSKLDDDHLFKVLLDMSLILDKANLLSVSSLHAGLLLLQRVLVSISSFSNFRLPLSGGLAWTFLMVHAAHCALRLPWTHLAIMLLSAKGGGGDVVSHHNKLCDILVSRWKWVTISPVTAAPVQLTLWFQTGSWASQQLSHLRLILKLFWKRV